MNNKKYQEIIKQAIKQYCSGNDLTTLPLLSTNKIENPSHFWRQRRNAVHFSRHLRSCTSFPKLSASKEPIHPLQPSFSLDETAT